MSYKFKGEESKKAWRKKQPHPKAPYNTRMQNIYKWLDCYEALRPHTKEEINKLRSEKIKQTNEKRIARERANLKNQGIKTPEKLKYIPPILSNREEVEVYLDVYQDCLDRMNREIKSSSDGGLQHTDLLKKYRGVKRERDKFRMMNEYFII